MKFGACRRAVRDKLFGPMALAIAEGTEHREGKRDKTPSRLRNMRE